MIIEAGFSDIIFLFILISIVGSVIKKFKQFAGQTGEEQGEDGGGESEIGRRLRELIEQAEDREPSPPPRPAPTPRASMPQAAPVMPPPPPPKPKPQPVPVAMAEPKIERAEPMGETTEARIQPAKTKRKRAPRRAAAPTQSRRRRKRIRLNPGVMGKVAILSEIWRPPVAMRDKPPWER